MNRHLLFLFLFWLIWRPLFLDYLVNSIRRCGEWKSGEKFFRHTQPNLLFPFLFVLFWPVRCVLIFISVLFLSFVCSEKKLRKERWIPRTSRCFLFFSSLVVQLMYRTSWCFIQLSSRAWKACAHQCSWNKEKQKKNNIVSALTKTRCFRKNNTRVFLSVRGRMKENILLLDWERINYPRRYSDSVDMCRPTQQVCR